MAFCVKVLKAAEHGLAAVKVAAVRRSVAADSGGGGQCIRPRPFEGTYGRPAVCAFAATRLVLRRRHVAAPAAGWPWQR
eukprot:120513-Chlamydomonas_euryale.AAC.1